jgi:hypothetical protein
MCVMVRAAAAVGIAALEWVRCLAAAPPRIQTPAVAGLGVVTVLRRTTLVLIYRRDKQKNARGCGRFRRWDKNRYQRTTAICSRLSPL